MSTEPFTPRISMPPELSLIQMSPVSRTRMFPELSSMRTFADTLSIVMSPDVSSTSSASVAGVPKLWNHHADINFGPVARRLELDVLENALARRPRGSADADLGDVRPTGDAKHAGSGVDLEQGHARGIHGRGAWGIVVLRERRGGESGGKHQAGERGSHGNVLGLV